MPGAATCGYRVWVLVGVAGEKVALTFPSFWGLPEIEHLVYFLLLHKGDRGVKSEESKYAARTILDFHDALSIATSVMLADVRSNESSR